MIRLPLSSGTVAAGTGTGGGGVARYHRLLPGVLTRQNLPIALCRQELSTDRAEGSRREAAEPQARVGGNVAADTHRNAFSGRFDEHSRLYHDGDVTWVARTETA